MDVLFDIPVVGLVLEFGVYLVTTLPNVSPIILAAATPLALGALCGVLNERSGIVNIGIEGMMLASAFTAWYAASLFSQAVPSASGPLGVTPALAVGLAVGLGTGLLISVGHAWLSVSIRADQIISGAIINILAFGITGYLNLLISETSPPSAGRFTNWDPPTALTDLPLIGWLFDMFMSQGPIAMSVIVLVVGLQVLLFRSRWGLRTRAVGEHPKAAETVGIDVIRLRYRNVILAGLFAGLAGAYLTMEGSSSFQTGMTNGRGFIALAAVIFGRWTPLGAFGATLLFAASQSLGIAIQIAPPAGDLGAFLSPIPPHFYQALPYVVTIIILAGVVGRSIPPAAVGRPYEREAKAV